MIPVLLEFVFEVGLKRLLELHRSQQHVAVDVVVLFIAQSSCRCFSLVTKDARRQLNRVFEPFKLLLAVGASHHLVLQLRVELVDELPQLLSLPDLGLGPLLLTGVVSIEVS